MVTDNFKLRDASPTIHSAKASELARVFTLEKVKMKMAKMENMAEKDKM